MQKKLLTLAIAGALAVPTAAMAQVTISGIIKVGLDRYSVGNAVAGRAHNSEWRVTDNSSRMIFGITENIGGGLEGIAQVDVRFQPDDAGGGFAESGNTWVGLRSKSWGTLTLGRHDLHYGKQPDETAAYAGALMAAAVSIMDFDAAGNAIANATRTPNVIRWDSPKWGGFALTAAYSTNAAGNESELRAGAATGRGNAWTINPSYTASNWQIGWSHWDSEGDTGGAASDQESDVLYGFFSWGGFKVGLAVNQSETNNGATGAAGTDRRAWSIPVRWASGPHHIAGHYSRASDDDVLGGNTGAKMWAVAYSYLLSKRTSVGVTYARLDNEAGAAYNFFTNTGGLGSTNSTLAAGEDGRLLAFTVRHAF